MKLISMTDFVLEQTVLLYEKNTSKLIHRIVNYAQFLKQPLILGMFVPCDEDGNILEYPIYKTNHSDECYCKKCEEETKRCDILQKKYNQAKERVLFEGFEIVEKREVYDSIKGILIDLDTQTFQIEGSLGVGGGYLINETIEDLSTLGITLTENAIKQIGI